MTPSFSQKGLDWARIICERGLNWGKNGPKIGVWIFFPFVNNQLILTI